MYVFWHHYFIPKTDRVAILALAAIAAAAAAFLATAPNAYAQTTTSQVTANSQLSNGTAITGYYSEAVSISTATTQSGFTPAAFTLNNGETYSVSVADWLDYFFDHWLDTGSTERWRNVTVTADTQLTAIYRDESVSQQTTAPAPDSGINYVYVSSMANKISAYGGMIPDQNLSGYKLSDGSVVAEYHSMYSLVNAGINLSPILRAAELAGLNWMDLTEDQQCYLALMLNLNIQLDENGLPL